MGAKRAKMLIIVPCPHNFAEVLVSKPVYVNYNRLGEERLDQAMRVSIEGAHRHH